MGEGAISIGLGKMDVGLLEAADGRLSRDRE
jgi:hypothetical protein